VEECGFNDETQRNYIPGQSIRSLDGRERCIYETLRATLVDVLGLVLSRFLFLFSIQNIFLLICHIRLDSLGKERRKNLAGSARSPESCSMFMKMKKLERIVRESDRNAFRTWFFMKNRTKIPSWSSRQTGTCEKFKIPSSSWSSGKFLRERKNKMLTRMSVRNICDVFVSPRLYKSMVRFIRSFWLFHSFFYDQRAESTMATHWIGKCFCTLDRIDFLDAVITIWCHKVQQLIKWSLITATDS
jgi:hypothetical protein